MPQKKVLLHGFIVLLFLFSTIGAMFKFQILASAEQTIISPLVKESKESAKSQYGTEIANNNYLSILILGIDRRSRQEGYRTDVMILAILNKETNKALLVSVPRDLWYSGGRLNALYPGSGWESTQRAFTEITGFTPDRYILTDFADFAWIIDSMGGVPVDVENSFTDVEYPVDETFGYQTVSFTKGYEKMTGERALIFARSRKGDYDNGDWGRMKRQHLLLKGILEAVAQPESFICKSAPSHNSESTCENNVSVDTLIEAFKTVTTAKMDTNIQLKDLEYFWDLYKDRKNYDIASLLMDSEFVYSPPMAEYGGAWVLAPVDNDYTKFHEAIKERLSNFTQTAIPTSAEDSESVAL